MEPIYVEIIIKGNTDLIRGFVLGYLEGRGKIEDTFVEEPCRLEEDSPLNFILHFFREHPHVVPVIARSGFYEPFCRAIMNCKKEISSEIVSVREITGASFTLHFKTYSKELGKTLRNLLTDLPLGVAMKKESRFQEETEPDCKGMETFAPLHEYALSFSGAFQGGIKEIYYLYCKVGRFEVVELGKLELEYGKDLKFPVPG